MTEANALSRSVRDRYDAWHDARATLDDLERDLENPWHAFVRRQIGLVAGRRVLEIACGRGQLSVFLACRGARVVSADFSARALGDTRSRLAAAGQPIRAALADAEQLPLAEGSVALVISCETIEHLAHPRRALAEFRRVLAPGGRLLLTFPSNLNLMGLHRLYLCARGRPYDSGAGVQPIERWLFAPLVVSWLRRTGFRLLRTEGLAHYVPVPGRPPMRMPWLERRRWTKALARHVGIVAERRT